MARGNAVGRGSGWTSSADRDNLRFSLRGVHSIPGRQPRIRSRLNDRHVRRNHRRRGRRSVCRRAHMGRSIEAASPSDLRSRWFHRNRHRPGRCAGATSGTRIVIPESPVNRPLSNHKPSFSLLFDSEARRCPADGGVPDVWRDGDTADRDCTLETLFCTHVEPRVEVRGTLFEHRSVR